MTGGFLIVLAILLGLGYFLAGVSGTLFIGATRVIALNVAAALLYG